LRNVFSLILDSVIVSDFFFTRNVFGSLNGLILNNRLFIGSVFYAALSFHWGLNLNGLDGGLNVLNLLFNGGLNVLNLLFNGGLDVLNLLDFLDGLVNNLSFDGLIFGSLNNSFLGNIFHNFLLDHLGNILSLVFNLIVVSHLLLLGDILGALNLFIFNHGFFVRDVLNPAFSLYRGLSHDGLLGSLNVLNGLLLGSLNVLNGLLLGGLNVLNGLRDVLDGLLFNGGLNVLNGGLNIACCSGGVLGGLDVSGLGVVQR
jgi:hypothetical protein